MTFRRSCWIGWLLLSCRAGAPVSPVPPMPVLPFAAESLRSQAVAPGITRWYLHSRQGPWAIHVLDVRLDRCYSVRAVKGAQGAAGREKTSILLADLQSRERVLGGVNADFFLFAPPGVPTGAHISQGRVITGPSARPVLAFDSAGRPRILQLRTAGHLTVAGKRFELVGWNRATPGGLALFDEAWGRTLDTASAVIEVLLQGGVVQAVDTALAGAAIPPGGRVLVAGRGAPPELRRALTQLRAGDSVLAAVSLGPIAPREAVSGRPVLVRDSALTPEVDLEEGQSGFVTRRHPRTAVGLGAEGRRLLLVVVDGRQAPYSDGMTLRELGSLLLALGAHDALNLDGGGSSTLIYADPDAGGRLRIGNRPSDAAGERPVGNALAVVRGCRPGS